MGRNRPPDSQAIWDAAARRAERIGVAIARAQPDSQSRMQDAAAALDMTRKGLMPAESRAAIGKIGAETYKIGREGANVDANSASQRAYEASAGLYQRAGAQNQLSQAAQTRLHAQQDATPYDSRRQPSYRDVSAGSGGDPFGGSVGRGMQPSSSGGGFQSGFGGGTDWGNVIRDFSSGAGTPPTYAERYRAEARNVGGMQPSSNFNDAFAGYGMTDPFAEESMEGLTRLGAGGRVGYHRR